MKKLTYLIALALIFMLVGCGSTATSKNSVVATPVATNAIIDANQFSSITPENLISIMGTPSSIDKWDYKSPNGTTYKAITYSYNKKVCYEFLVIDNSVVRFNFNSEKFNDNNGKSIKFNDKKELLPMFGITPSSDIKNISDTGVALRYQLVSDKIADFWVVDIDKENKSFDTVKITYNLNYF